MDRQMNIPNLMDPAAREAFAVRLGSRQTVGAGLAAL